MNDELMNYRRGEEPSGMANPVIIKGEVEVFLLGPKDEIKEYQVVENLVTTAGDEYYAKKSMVGISPSNPSAPTAASGMKLGTGSTAVAKSGAGAALVTYESGSNNPFDATFPLAEDLTGDTGWAIQYQTTWGPGDVVEAALREVVLVNDAGTDATSTAANTYSRVVFGSIDKQAGDTLIILWKHIFLGA